MKNPPQFKIKYILTKKTTTPREKIREVVYEKGMTFKEVANLANISDRKCSNFFTKQNYNTSIYNYIEILKAIDISKNLIMPSLHFYKYDFQGLEHLGKYIEFLRKENKYSKKYVVDSLKKSNIKISPRRYSSIENGQDKNIGISTIDSIGRILRNDKLSSDFYTPIRKAIVFSKFSIPALAEMSNLSSHTWYSIYDNPRISLYKYVTIMKTLGFNLREISNHIGLNEEIAPTQESIGKYLKELRLSSHVSVKHISKSVNISEINYYLIENGKNNALISTFVMLINNLKEMREINHILEKRMK